MQDVSSSDPMAESGEMDNDLVSRIKGEKKNLEQIKSTMGRI